MRKNKAKIQMLFAVGAALLNIGFAFFFRPALALADPPDPALNFLNFSPTPPMGWNSWDCFGAAVTEDQTLANAQYIADHLKSHGWQYVTVDIQWYEPNAKADRYRKGAKLEMDEYGRLLPAINRFPSALVGKSVASTTLSADNISYELHTGANVNESNPEEVLMVDPINGIVLRCDGSVLVDRKYRTANRRY